ncbi:MAG: magnesium/cobalt transporter CorA [Asgard group archaeon]|nr:magnesium/cobalt transporter CorA [Asgard group archaeon]
MWTLKEWKKAKSSMIEKQKEIEKCKSAEISDSLVKFLIYDQDNYEEGVKTNELPVIQETSKIKWLNIIGVQNSLMLKELGEKYSIHPLIIEDIQSPDQRLKIDYFADYVYFVLKSIDYDENNELIIEQISIVLGDNFLISFQEYDPDEFDTIRVRLSTARGRVRKMGDDYLAYTLLDVLIDNFFIFLENFGDKIDLLEDELITEPDKETLQTIYKLKRDILLIRKSIWALRDALSRLSRGETDFVKDSTLIYYRDVYDHVIQIVDTIETYREMLSGMLDIYLSSISNKMNEVMKVLTIIATIFIPLTFIVGLFGLNFEYMPELHYKWSYLIIIIIMLIISGGMIYFFRRRKWI